MKKLRKCRVRENRQGPGFSPGRSGPGLLRPRSRRGSRGKQRTGRRLPRLRHPGLRTRSFAASRRRHRDARSSRNDNEPPPPPPSRVGGSPRSQGGGRNCGRRSGSLGRFAASFPSAVSSAERGVRTTSAGPSGSPAREASGPERTRTCSGRPAAARLRASENCASATPAPQGRFPAPAPAAAAASDVGLREPAAAPRLPPPTPGAASGSPSGTVWDAERGRRRV